MAYSNVLDPNQMTTTQRRCEVASILAQGLIRLRIPSPGALEKGEQTALDLSARRSVHTNPASQVRMAIRDVLLAQQKEFE